MYVLAPLFCHIAREDEAIAQQRSIVSVATHTKLIRTYIMYVL